MWLFFQHTHFYTAVARLLCDTKQVHSQVGFLRKRLLSHMKTQTQLKLHRGLELRHKSKLRLRVISRVNLNRRLGSFRFIDGGRSGRDKFLCNFVLVARKLWLKTWSCLARLRATRRDGDVLELSIQVHVEGLVLIAIVERFFFWISQRYVCWV